MVKGYNCNLATRELDIWAITLVFAFLEGYYTIYYDNLYAPILKLLMHNNCIPKNAFILDINSLLQRRNYLRIGWENWQNGKDCLIKGKVINK